MNIKKNIAIILIVFLVFLCLFSFPACRTINELEAALNNSDFSNVLIELNNSADNTDVQSAKQAIDGDKVKITEGDTTYYIKKDNDDYYRYLYSKGKWRKEEYTYYISRFSTAVFSFAYFLDFEAQDFVKSDFGYSMLESARKEYCDRIFVYQWKSLGAQVNFAEVEYLTLKISNEKISEFDLKYSLILGEQPVQTISISLLLSDYGNIKVELPEAEEIPLISSIQERFQNFGYQTTILDEKYLEPKMIRGFTATKYNDYVIIIEYEDALTAQNSLDKFEYTEECMLRGRYVCYANGNSQSAFSYFKDFFHNYD